MKQNVLGILSFLLFSSAVPAQGVGDVATDFRLLDDSGGVTQFADFTGTPLILNFWASWCEPCVEELPFFERLQSELNEGKEVPALQVLLVNNGEVYDAARAFLREDLNSTLASGFDASKEQLARFKAAGIDVQKTIDVVKSYRVRGMPTTFFIDAAGVIQAIKVGILLPDEAPALLARIGLEWQP
jgi:thiol-disulfide isomerase/thioredoxin